MKRILIVDDDANFAHSLAKILKLKGTSTTVVTSCEAGLQAIQQEEFSLVLMDVRMPVMDGVEAFKRMKALRPGLIVILMTAYALDDLLRDAIRDGVFAVVRKPLDVEHVIRLIGEADRGGLVVVIDDEPDLLKLMARELTGRGLAVTTCGSGEEAIELARCRHIRLVLIDLRLPALNGLETYLELKKLQPGIVAIMLTAFQEELSELLRQAMAASAYACLTKPFEPEAAMRLIEEALSRAGAGGKP